MSVLINECLELRPENRQVNPAQKSLNFELPTE